MNPLRNIFIIAALELQRLFSTRRGLLTVLAFSLVWALIFRYLIYGASVWLANGAGGVLTVMFNSQLVTSLLNWPVAEFSVFWVVSLYLLPLFCLLLAADQTASDRNRGTLRLLSLHTTRSSLLLGRFVGLMLVQSLLLAVVILTTLALAMARDASQLHAAVESAALVGTNLLLLLAAYTAAMAVVSLFAGSARQATTWAIVLWIVLSVAITWLSHRYPEMAVIKWLIPGAHITSLLHHNDWQSMQLAIVPIAQTLLLLGTGLFIINRRDL